jgi:hypothetical protein
LIPSEIGSAEQGFLRGKAGSDFPVTLRVRRETISPDTGTWI